MKTRLQKKRERDSLKQAGRYLLLTLTGLFLLVRFGLPSLINLAAFISDLSVSRQPPETPAELPPAPPALLPLPEATNSASITVAGYTDPGLTVKLTRGGIAIEETIAGNDGSFEFKATVLNEGDNEFFAEAVNSRGTAGEPSKIFRVVYDPQPPPLTIDQPHSGQRFFDKDSPITVAGNTEPDSQLTLNGRFIRVDADGRFNTAWPLSGGDNQLDFVVRDPAGNETKKILTVNYTP